jgi:outer membrane receptor protein involved in Fe transport
MSITIDGIFRPLTKELHALCRCPARAPRRIVMVKKSFLAFWLCLLSVASSAWAQNPTGTLSGRVTADAAAIPGATLSLSSPALQGSRTAISTENGEYIFRFLPPGDYEVSVELDGYHPAQGRARISAAQDQRLNFALQLSSVSEELIVVGALESISSSSQNSTTNSSEMIEALPVNRDLRQAVLLTPGVNATGPSDAITIAGAQSYENLFLVNGVVVNENVRGTPFTLFIEDAIQETTTTTSGVSAEYGRFAGGVVNVLTKSGGNEFSGSLRTSFTNQDWEEKTPITTTLADKTLKRYEATLGGRLIRDRLWFFLAGRDFEDINNAQTVATNIAFPSGNDQQRFEGKLTASLTDSHNIVASYLKIDDVNVGNRFGSILDLASVIDRETPQELKAFNYNGALTKNFFLEAQYSEREFAFIGAGSRFTDLVFGTLLVDRPTNRRWWSPTFCGVCLPEDRNNENVLAKGSYFLSAGESSHDLVFGYDTFDDVRRSDNHQSGSDYRFLISNTIIQGTNLFPVIDNNTIIQFNPILQSSKGTSFKTNSIFVNDEWSLNDRWSLNLGLRYDQNDGVDSAGTKVVDDSKISPRLSAAWDVKGDGDMIVNFAAARYVAAIAGAQANSASVGGTPATFQFNYRGPAINTGSGPFLTADVVIPQVFNWFNSVGGPNNTSFLRLVDVPGGNLVIGDDLASPHTDEFSIGLIKRLGSKGSFRVDLVHRESDDFYVEQRDISTGKGIVNGRPADLSVIVNDEDGLLNREYNGLHTQARYRFTDRFQIGANYTLSRTEGNFDGETVNSGPISSTIGRYPEYLDPAWHSPDGDLATDRRHNFRAWAIYQIFDTDHHGLSVSLLQNFASGLPYGAQGLVDSRNFVTNPGYTTPPNTVIYYFTERDAFRTEDVTATDLSLNYAFKFQVAGRQLEVFFQPEVLNVFNEDGIISTSTNFFSQAIFDATTSTATSCNGARCQPFNPFTTTPVEGVHWAKRPSAANGFGGFGQATTPDAYQTARTFRFSIGLRF